MSSSIDTPLYFIKRRVDKMWWTGESWSDTHAKAFSAAKAGMILTELPRGMEEGVYKLVQQK